MYCFIFTVRKARPQTQPRGAKGMASQRPGRCIENAKEVSYLLFIIQNVITGHLILYF